MKVMEVVWKLLCSWSSFRMKPSSLCHEIVLSVEVHVHGSCARLSLSSNVKSICLVPYQTHPSNWKPSSLDC